MHNKPVMQVAVLNLVAVREIRIQLESGAILESWVNKKIKTSEEIKNQKHSPCLNPIGSHRVTRGTLTTFNMECSNSRRARDEKFP